jgi:tape measure domain-containing protein
MADDTSVDIRLRLQDAKRFGQDADNSSKAIKRIGTAADQASRRARAAGSALDGLSGRLRNVRNAAGIASVALGGVFAAGIKSGLAFNAQVEDSVTRFALFAKNQQQATRLLNQVQRVNRNSTFDLGELANAAAYLGNSGIPVGRVAKGVQAIANAAAAAGGGNDRLDRIAIAIGQISTNGTVAKEDINQLTEAGINVAPVLKKAFHLSAQEYKNLGNQGISSNKAIAVLFDYFTSGKMADAARRQSRTFSGQIALMKDNIQSALGTLTFPLFDHLRSSVFPGINEALQGINWKKPLGKQTAFLNLKGIIVGEVQQAWRWLRDTGIPWMARQIPNVIKGIAPLLTAAGKAVAPPLIKGVIEGIKADPALAGIVGLLGIVGPKNTAKGAWGAIKGVGGWAFNKVFGSGKGKGGTGGTGSGNNVIVQNSARQAVPVYIVGGGGGGGGGVVGTVLGALGLTAAAKGAKKLGGKGLRGLGGLLKGGKSALGQLFRNPAGRSFGSYLGEAFPTLGKFGGPLGKAWKFLASERGSVGLGGLGKVGRIGSKALGWPLTAALTGWDIFHNKNSVYGALLNSATFGLAGTHHVDPAAAERQRRQAARAQGGATRRTYWDPQGFPISAAEWRRHQHDPGYGYINKGDTVIQVVMPNGKVLAETVLDEANKVKRRK